jgi:PII-like signaling protein
MFLPQEGQLLRIFIGESNRHEGLPLYEWLVRHARQNGLAGATVLRGISGFGANSRIHTANILRLSLDLPIVVEIVDEPAKIEAFLPVVDAVVKEGLVTLEKVQIKLYRANRENSAPRLIYASKQMRHVFLLFCPA